MSDSNADTQKGSSDFEKRIFQRKGFTFFGLGLQDVIRYFFGGNASLAIIILILICFFLAKEAAMFFPDHHRGLKAYRSAGQEFVDYIGQEIEQHTRIYSSANIAYFAEVNRTSLEEDAILRAQRAVLANVESLTARSWKELERGLDNLEDAQEDLDDLKESEGALDASALSKLTKDIAQLEAKIVTVRAKLKKEVTVVLGSEKAWDLGGGGIGISSGARAKVLDAVLFEAFPDSKEDHPFIVETKAASRAKKGLEAEKLAGFKDTLKALQSAVRPMKDLHSDLKKIALESRKEINSLETAPARRDAWLAGAESTDDPAEKARMLARAGEVVIAAPDLSALNAPIYSSVDEHRTLLATLQAEVERLHKDLPDGAETESGRKNLKKADHYYGEFVTTVRENRDKIQGWRHDKSLGLMASVGAFLMGKDWVTNSSWHDFYGLLPLFTGSFLISIIALVVAVPFAVSAAVYVNQLANRREQTFIKPAIEFIGAIPSVVLGFFGILVFGETLRMVSQLEYLQWIPGFPMAERLTILNAGLLLAFMAVPTIFTLTEDALNNVPRALAENSLAMGATKLQTVFRVIVPTAISGIIAAVLLGFGRIIGETMVVLLVAGNKIKIPDFTEGLGVIAQPAHTMTGIIAQELGEVDNGSLHWRALFMVGVILFVISLGVNFTAQQILKKLQKI
ncbi:phosphate ABC transporter permease subunit PstC [Verrucomicrobiales bacterium]|nr:phosphate ABC transporter permease subunit PstC [Verrucomicrobiales bacterium]